MQQYNDYFLLREAKQKMLRREEQAALQYTLGELKVSQPSSRQRLARVLVRMASRLDPQVQLHRSCSPLVRR